MERKQDISGSVFSHFIEQAINRLIQKINIKLQPSSFCCILLVDKHLTVSLHVCKMFFQDCYGVIGCFGDK